MIKGIYQLFLFIDCCSSTVPVTSVYWFYIQPLCLLFTYYFYNIETIIYFWMFNLACIIPWINSTHHDVLYIIFFFPVLPCQVLASKTVVLLSLVIRFLFILPSLTTLKSSLFYLNCLEEFINASGSFFVSCILLKCLNAWRSLYLLLKFKHLLGISLNQPLFFSFSSIFFFWSRKFFLWYLVLLLLTIYCFCLWKNLSLKIISYKPLVVSCQTSHLLRLLPILMRCPYSLWSQFISLPVCVFFPANIRLSFLLLSHLGPIPVQGFL